MSEIKAEKLKDRPMSGEYEENSFGYNTNELFWVRFSNKNKAWIGKFALGFKPYNNEIIRISSEKFFIIAGGLGYMFNADKNVCKFITEDDCYESGRYIEKRKELVLTDGLRVFILDIVNNKIIWKSERMSWDGIIFDKVIGNKIEGLTNDLSEQWPNCKFILDLNTKKISANCDIPVDKNIIYPKVPILKRIKKWYNNLR